ncbi:MAG: phage tail protein [Nodosilinea sp.]
MQEGTLGEIRLFAGNFAPRDWAFCHGQLLPIAQYTALFSILGTTYGGDGRTTFALPDLRGRFPIGASQGPNLTFRELGAQGGSETHTLNTSEMPARQSTLATSGKLGTASDPGNLVAAGASDGPTGKVTTAVDGGNRPHNNMPPYLGINYVICLQGYYPSRS